MYISKGFKYLAAGIGAGEVAIWLLSTGLVITHLTNIPGILAYIAGYVIGTIVGIDLEDRLKVGNVIVRIIAKNDPVPMMLALRDRGFGITRLDGSGSFGSPGIGPPGARAAKRGRPVRSRYLAAITRTLS